MPGASSRTSTSKASGDGRNERFELWTIANDGADTREIASLLAPGPEHHPWLLRLTPDQVQTPVESPPLAAVIVTRTADLDTALANVRNALRGKAVPVIVVRVGDTGPVASAPRAGEDARVAVTGLDETARAPVAATLVSVFRTTAASRSRATSPASAHRCSSR